MNDTLDGLPGAAAAPIEGALEVLTDDEFCRIRPGEHLVEGILPVAGEVVVTGGFSGGKSALLQNLAMHVSLGRDWYGRTVRGGRVLYLVGEGVTGTADRWRRLKEHLAVPSTETYFVRVPLTLMDGRVPARIADGLLQTLGEEPTEFAMVIADTWSRLGSGAEENSNDDCMTRLHTLSALGEAIGGATRVIIHHPGNGAKENGQRGRGASALEAAVDTVIRVERPRDSETGTVRCDKQRDGEPFAPFNYTLQRGLVVEVEPPVDPDTWQVLNRLRLSPQEEAALKVLDEAQRDPEYADRGMSVTQWREAMEIPRSTHDPYRKRLLDLGFVRAEKDGRHNNYRITPGGVNALIPTS